MFATIKFEKNLCVLAYGEGTDRKRVVGKQVCKTDAEKNVAAAKALVYLSTLVEKGEVVIDRFAKNEVETVDDLDKTDGRNGEFWKFAARELKALVPEQVWKDAIGEAYKVCNLKTKNSEFYKVLKAEVDAYVEKVAKRAAKGNKA